MRALELFLLLNLPLFHLKKKKEHYNATFIIIIIAAIIMAGMVYLHRRHWGFNKLVFSPSR